MNVLRRVCMGGLGALLMGCQVTAPTQGAWPPGEPLAASPGERMDNAVGAPADPVRAPTASLAPAAAPLPAGPSAMAIPADAYVPDVLLVALRPGVTAKEFLALGQAQALQLERELTIGGHALLKLRVPAGVTLAAARAQLARAKGVAAVYLDMRQFAHGSFIPSDEFYPDQWSHHPKFGNTEGAWDRLKQEGISAKNVIVANLDSGVDADHPDFQDASGKSRVLALEGINTPALNANPDPRQGPTNFTGDFFGHGTFTAGIVGATGNNSEGMAGVAWDVKIMPIKADHPERPRPGDPTETWGHFDLSDVVAGIIYACDNNEVNGAKIRVLNMSLGQSTSGVEPLYVEALAYARSKGILSIASTGNASASEVPPPANTPGVIAVGATSRYLDFEFTSPDQNYGPRLDIVAPGGGIISTVPHQRSDLGSRTLPLEFLYFAWGSGTSEAAPYVSGVAALVFAKYDPNNASLSTGNAGDAGKMVDRVRAHLLRSVDDLGATGWDPAFGAGRLNADKALAAPLPLPDGPQPAY